MGTILSERQWGTCREDYSEDGNAWDYFTHDQSRSRAYRWGEDGMAGISDDKQQLCFALALWNGRDPDPERAPVRADQQRRQPRRRRQGILLLSRQHSDALVHEVPLQVSAGGIPYRDLVETNGRRSREEMEYELLDTGIFDDDRYFDVFVEYAKADPEDMLIRISVHNRGPEAAQIHVLPTLWFRNTWSWGDDEPKPVLGQIGREQRFRPRIRSSATTRLQCEGAPELLFTENESNASRLWGQPNPSPYVKDAFHEYVISRQAGCRESREDGHQSCRALRAGCSGRRKQGRAFAAERQADRDAFATFDQIFASRLADADEFYERITPKNLERR